MTREDQMMLALGREIVRMIHDIRQTVAQGETGYGRRKITFPRGEVHVFIAHDAELADFLETAVKERYNVASVTPPSQRN